MREMAETLEDILGKTSTFLQEEYIVDSLCSLLLKPLILGLNIMGCIGIFRSVEFSTFAKRIDYICIVHPLLIKNAINTVTKKPQLLQPKKSFLGNHS